MSSVQLLDKTRKIGKLLHNNNSSKVVFSDICKVMREILNSNVLVISRKGKVLGVGKSDGIEPITELLDDNIGGFIDPMLNERAYYPRKRTSTWRLLALKIPIRENFRRSSLRSRLPESVWEPSSFTNAMNSMILMILSFANMVPQWWDWKCCGL